MSSSTGPTFQEAINRPQIDVVLAALCFAREIAYPDLDVIDYLARLDGLRSGAQTFISPSHTTSEQAESLADYLFINQRFRGNTGDYNDPDNSYLNEVIDRRLGIPISLSVVYIAIAQELGIPARGVGLPGHFIVGVQEELSEIYIDPFHGGVRLSREDCAQLVRDSTGFTGEFQGEWLAPVPPRAILTRMLNNLRNIYLQKEDWARSLAVVEHLQLLQPRLPDLQRDLGLIYHRKGALRLAVQHYEAYLLQAPAAPDAEGVRDHLRRAARQLARLN